MEAVAPAFREVGDQCGSGAAGGGGSVSSRGRWGSAEAAGDDMGVD